MTVVITIPVHQAQLVSHEPFVFLLFFVFFP